MDIQIKILITQVAMFFVIQLLIHPITPIARYLEKVFSDYGKVLDYVCGTQFILVFINLIVFVWRVY